MDPEQNQGEGLGLAPIGHTVTIEGVTSEIINISTKVTLEPAITWEDVAISMQSTVDEYFLELNEEWENQDNIIVRISQIESRLVAVAGIVDIENTKINGLAANYIVPAYKVVARGTVTNG